MLTRQGNASFILMLENGLFFRDEAFKGGKLEFLAKKTDELVIPEVAGDAFYHERKRGFEVYANLNILGVTDVLNEDEETTPLRVKIGFIDTGSQRTELNQSVLYQGIKKANNRDLVDTWTTKHESYLDWAARVTVGEPEEEGEEDAAEGSADTDALVVSQETVNEETEANAKRLEKLITFMDKRIAAISDNDDEESEDTEDEEPVYLSLEEVLEKAGEEHFRTIVTGAGSAMNHYLEVLYAEANAPKKAAVKTATVKPETPENPKLPATAKPPGSKQVPPRGQSQPATAQTEEDLDIARGKGGRGNGAAPKETPAS